MMTANKIADRQNPIVIVGAGITGCVAGHRLASKGHKVIVVEREGQVGGLARTFRYDDFSFDIGPHRFFSRKPETLSYIQHILGKDCRPVARRSAIYFLNQYYAWPLRPSVLFKLPLHIGLPALGDLLYICFNSTGQNDLDFENCILNNYGRTLYHAFFKEYTTKFLNMPPHQVHADWARNSVEKTIIDNRIAHKTLVDILKQILCLRPIRTQFLYPRRGIDELCRNLAEEMVTRYNGNIFTHTTIAEIKHTGGTIEEIAFDGIRVRPAQVIWTGNLNDLCRLMKAGSPALYYLSILIFNIRVCRPPVRNHQWCYFGNKEIFSRVSVPCLFSRSMAPPGRHGLCAEVTCREGDALWEKPDTLRDKIIKDLLRVGIVRNRSDIEGIHIEKIRDAYPIYSLNYQQQLRAAHQHLRRTKNLILAGRSGLFWYNNMDQSIENALAVAQTVLRHA